MKTLLSFAIALLFSVTSIAQTVIYSSNFQDWTGNTPDGWVGTKTSIETDSIMMATGGEYGTNLCQLTNEENSHKRFTTLGLPVEGGITYEVEFWVRGNGQIRTALWDSEYGTYNGYIDVDASTSENYSQSVLADTTFSMAEFIISVRNTTGNHIQLDSVVIKTGTPVEPTEISISEIQYTENVSGDSPYNNQPILTSGVVTAVLDEGYYIQDGIGGWNGIFIFDSNNSPEIGDLLNISGSVSEFYTFTEIVNITNFEVVSSGNAVVANETSTASINTEMWEGTLVKASGANCTAGTNNFGEWTINDGSGDVLVDDLLFSYDPVEGTEYDVTGVVYFSFGSTNLLPRDANDIEETVVSVEEVNALDINLFPTPFTTDFTVELNGTYTLNIITLDGKIVATEQLQNKAVVNTTALASGMYMIQIIQGNNTSSTLVEKR